MGKVNKSIEDEFLTEVDATIKTHKKSTKKKINSKRKGSRAELDLAHILTNRFDGYTFARSVQSGAYIGKSNDIRAKSMTDEQKLVFAGDIRVPVNFKYVIEHKAYNPEGHELFWELFNEKSDLHKWLEQVTHDSELVDKKPMLVIKYNNKKRICFMHENPVEPVFLHNGWNCYRFDDILNLENSFFFEN